MLETKRKEGLEGNDSEVEDACERAGGVEGLAVVVGVRNISRPAADDARLQGRGQPWHQRRVTYSGHYGQRIAGKKSKCVREAI